MLLFSNNNQRLFCAARNIYKNKLKQSSTVVVVVATKSTHIHTLVTDTHSVYVLYVLTFSDALDWDYGYTTFLGNWVW